VVSGTLLLGCGGPRRVTVRISIPDESGVVTPLAGVRVMLLPYDRDSIRSALTGAASTPRPPTERMDTLFQQFREPFGAYLRLAVHRQRLERRRDSAEAAGAGQVVTAAEDSLEHLAGPLEVARRRLDSARANILPEATRLRQALAAWEDDAFRAYDSITSAITRQLGRPAVIDSTGAAGWTTLTVPDGTWWVHARAVNVLDPNAEWYWNVPLSRDTILLTPANGRSQPRL